MLIVGTAATLGLYFYVARDLPSPDSIVKARQQFETTLITDRSGATVLYQVIDPTKGLRQWTPIDDVPADLIHATVAIEDKSFYSNPGFDVRGIARAVAITLGGGNLQGGSTITQQLVKNVVIAPDQVAEPTIQRKLKEIILASEITRRYTKAQVLELYLNTNFYGNLAYGIDAASKVYFDKPVHNLTLGEATLLAAIPQNPQLNPLDNWQAARARQVVVLDTMAAQGYITVAQAHSAASEPIVVAPLASRNNLIAPHFSLYARQQAEQLLTAQGLDGARLVARGGLHIYTTLDLDLQYQAECTARSTIARLAGGSPTTALNTSAGTPCAAAIDIPPPPAGFAWGIHRNVTNASIVVMRPNTGEILSMVGSLDYWNPGIDGNYNVALGARQPGSTFKLFTYTAALASSFTPASMLLDVPTAFSTGGGPLYKPTNEDNTFHGPVSLREAFANSYNVPAVSVLRQVGIADVIRKAHLLGINGLNGSLDQYGLALTLGGSEVSLLDMTYAYGVFANMGTMAGTPAQNLREGYRQLDPVAVLRIDDANGHTLWKFEQHTATFGVRSVVNTSLAYLINNILSDNQARVPAFGKNNALELSRPAAAKTGTTNNARDGWTIGYTPQLVTGVWVGNNDNTPMGDDVLGINSAAPIWHAIMEYAHSRDSLPVQNWPRPSTIIDAVVCKDSGLLPTADCPHVNEIFFAEGGRTTVPQQTDIYYKRLTINARNGLLATASTPADVRQDKIYFDYPPSAREWARGAGQPLPPTEFDTGGSTVTPNGLAINRPAALSRVRGTINILGDLTNKDMAFYTVAYGVGLSPRDWINIGGDATTRGQNVVLGSWNTAGLDGLYTLRLQIVLKDKSALLTTTQLTVDNVPPTVQLNAPQPGTTINGNTVRLEATATDNLSDGVYVEFYHDDTLIDTVRSAPFATTWKVNGASGTQLFYAIVYDAAGNSVKSPVVSVTTTGK